MMGLTLGTSTGTLRESSVSVDKSGQFGGSFFRQQLNRTFSRDPTPLTQSRRVARSHTGTIDHRPSLSLSRPPTRCRCRARPR
jgi:hypothetical protein